MGDILKSFHGEFAWFIWGLIALGAIWFFTGGTESETAHEGAYLEPLAPVDSGQAYGTYYEGGDIRGPQELRLPQAPGNLVRSLFYSDEKTPVVEPEKTDAPKDAYTAPLSGKSISFEDIGNARESDPTKEYLRIETSPEASPQKITGLVLRGTGKSASILIPQATSLFVLGSTPVKSDVVMPPDGHAIISTSRSPVGASFRVNKCSGYLDQFQDFVPDLDKRCPTPLEELKRFGPDTDAACVEFAEKSPRCEIPQGAPSKGATSACVSFLAEELNYNACVANHKNDRDFYKNEWRLFLNQPNELWKNRDEIIRLTDTKGAVLDAITY